VSERENKEYLEVKRLFHFFLPSLTCPSHAVNLTMSATD
jgi:hypothetical protein